MSATTENIFFMQNGLGQVICLYDERSGNNVSIEEYRSWIVSTLQPADDQKDGAKHK